MYLWHYPMLTIFQYEFSLATLLRFLITFPLTVLLAVLSYVLIEQHFMRTTDSEIGPDS
jgi:peptidoglycan/LPS O-acetylase OafA/YrhL